MTERRRRERYAFTTPATLESGGVQTCGSLLDVSLDGVRVRLAADPSLRDTCIFSAMDFGVRIPGRIIWRRGREVGIRFVTETAETPPRSSFGRRRLQG